ncbi:MAG: NAD-dependent protein deacylase [Bacilli bacterium]|nr:NAD-dependent protein deacylase [Bacilli bacterium]
MLTENQTKLKELIKQSKHIVFLTGAGISKPSGIPDIRGADGLSKRQANDIKYGATYEEIVSHSYFMMETAKFYRYYFNEMIYLDAKPNKAHLAIARLGDKATVVTQNIDALHTRAGSKDVIEVHGSTYKNRCLGCHQFYTLDEIIKLRDENGVPKCPKCGKVIKPEVVLFEEPLNEGDIDAAVNAMMHADLLIVIGSSLVVNPAASLPFYYPGKNFVIINKEPTPLDARASIIIREPVESFIDEVID